MAGHALEIGQHDHFAFGHLQSLPMLYGPMPSR
jgi:hypothetical protein